MEDDLRKFEELAGSFAARELSAKAWGADLLEKAQRAGLLTIMLPEEFGGGGGAIGALCVILRTVCRFDASLGGFIFANALAQALLSEAKADGLLKAAAERLIAFPIYSDLSPVELPEAVRTGGAYALTGDLGLVVPGRQAAQAIVPARTQGHVSRSFFMIDLEGPGVDVSPPVMTLGLRACPAADISMRGAAARLIGEEGAAEGRFGRIAWKMNAAAAAMNVGIMEGSLGEAAAYARERFQGGRPIIKWSQVEMILADMTMKTGAAVLCLEQAWQDPRLSTAAALHIHELACDVVTNGVQVLGGYGYMKDYGQEKRYRDARQVQALLGAPLMRKLSLMNGEL